MESDNEVTPLAPVNPATESFFIGAYRRIQLTITVLGVIGSIVVLFVFGWRVAAGFLLGASLAYLNFLWLKQSIIALTDRISAQENAPQGRALVFKFIFRYLVIATVAYAIISRSSISVLGLIAGFFLSVVAFLFEAVTEVIYALRHGD
ncbi:MAG TPA: ATP synthase subunit I [Terriglobales bacterium]|nr:ATP synthase subunit I [Terriglobales bacterium]